MTKVVGKTFIRFQKTVDLALVVYVDSVGKGGNALRHKVSGEILQEDAAFVEPRWGLSLLRLHRRNDRADACRRDASLSPIFELEIRVHVV